MNVKLLTEHHLEFLSSLGGCTGSSESTLDKLPHCWKSHAVAQMICAPIKDSYQPGHQTCQTIAFLWTQWVSKGSFMVS